MEKTPIDEINASFDRKMKKKKTDERDRGEAREYYFIPPYDDRVARCSVILNMANLCTIIANKHET